MKCYFSTVISEKSYLNVLLWVLDATPGKYSKICLQSSDFL